MLIIGIPLLFALIGLLMYVLATNPKVQELGRLLFFAGFFVALFIFGQGHVRLP